MLINYNYDNYIHRYNTRYGSPVIQNTYSRGKKMIFYGVHTSVFRG